jgi:two-component system, OmpR family, sensor kinase
MQTPSETQRDATGASHMATAAAGLRHALPLFALAVSGPLALIALASFPSLNQVVLASPTAHLAITGAAALLGIVLALLVIRTSSQAQDARVFLIGLGLLSIAGLFSVHSLSTPDVLIQGRGVITGWSAQLSLLVGGVILAVSGVELGPALGAMVMRRAHLILLLFTLLWIGVALALLEPWRPASEPVTPGATSYEPGGASEEHSHTPSAAAPGTGDGRTALALLGVTCYAAAAWRHYQLYRHAPSPTGRSIVAGIVLFGLALISQWQSRQVYTLSFWLYHLQEFAGFGVISYAVLTGYRRGQSGAGLLESLFLGGTRARLQSGYAAALQDLIDTLARGEQPEAAQRRDLQARLGLSESQIRVFEQAAGAVAQERRQRQELEQLNQRLLQLQHDKEQMTQMVIHDLKNPLTALIGFLEIMQIGQGQLDENQRELLDSALRSGRSLAGLIGDLLDAARLEEGKLELDYSVVEAEELLRDCAGQMGAWLIQEEKTIRIDAREGASSLIADRRLLRRVLLNLISNAIKHTPARTTITLRTRGGGEQLVIEVEDDGDGIAPEHLERIFERFALVGGAGDGRQHNTGLGLSFCRLAVEAHGGTIAVESQLGKGALFRITLPVDGPYGGRGERARATHQPV